METARALWLQNRPREALALSERCARTSTRREPRPLRAPRRTRSCLDRGGSPRRTRARHELMEAFDLSTLHGGYGSDLMLAIAAMQELRLARDRERAVELARRALESGAAPRDGASRPCTTRASR